MDSFAQKPGTRSSPAEPSVIARVPVLGVVLAAACSLGASAVMSGYEMGGPPLFATLVAVGGGVVWWYAPRTGYWVLLSDGLVTMAASGVALAQGAVPWLLVAFWGGSALLLAAILHATAGAGRSGTVTLVAVISLLVLSALGLGQYVRSTWTQNERVILQGVPGLVGAHEAAWTARVTPAPDGAWCSAWIMETSQTEALGMIRAALAKNGWRVVDSSAERVSAHTAGVEIDVEVADVSGPYPRVRELSSAGTQLVVTVRRAPAAGAP